MTIIFFFVFSVLNYFKENGKPIVFIKYHQRLKWTNFIYFRIKTDNKILDKPVNVKNQTELYLCHSIFQKMILMIFAICFIACKIKQPVCRKLSQENLKTLHISQFNYFYFNGNIHQKGYFNWVIKRSTAELSLQQMQSNKAYYDNLDSSRFIFSGKKPEYINRVCSFRFHMIKLSQQIRNNYYRQISNSEALTILTGTLGRAHRVI